MSVLQLETAAEDVDVVCEVASRVKYHQLGDRLRARGLQEAMGTPVICRWRSDDPQLVLDVMPTDPDILGFSNPWYEEAISSAVTVTLESGAEIRAAAPPALVATKLCAWKGRGGGDLLPSLGAVQSATASHGPAGAGRVQVVQARINELLA